MLKTKWDATLPTGHGYTAGLRVFFKGKNSRLPVLGLGLFYSQYAGGMEQSNYEMWTKDYLQLTTIRKVFSSVFYPLTLGLCNSRLRLSIGFQNDVLIAHNSKTYIRKDPYNGPWPYERKYETDIFNLNRHLVTGLVVSLSMRTLKIGTWTLKPRYSSYFGLNSDYNLSRSNSYRQIFELGMSKKLYGDK